MKTLLVSLLTVGLIAGAANARSPFDQIDSTAPRAPFDQIQDTAPRSPFDQINSTAP